MTDKEIIRKKILEVKKNCLEVKDILPSDKLLDAQIKVADYLLSFIDSMQEEPVSEDLEEAANDAVISLVPSFGQKYSDGSYVSCIRDSFKREELIKLYKAGAEWQKQKDESYTKSMYKVGINTGKELMKQQLMAKAVKVNISNASIVSLPVNCDLKVGDKVLIIKQE